MYKLTEEHKRHISEAKKGIPLSKEHKDKVIKKALINGEKTKFKKGNVPWNKNIKGYHVHSDEWKIKQKDRMSGEKHPFFGKHPTKEMRDKISNSLLGRHVSPKTEFKKGEMSMEKHPGWLGGLSFEPYTPEFNEEFKNLIRLRDNFCCLNCGISEQKHKIILNTRLVIHHINYNKKDTCLQNCCALCLKCHLLTNKNRDSWTPFFQDVLSKKYNYIYLEKLGLLGQL